MFQDAMEATREEREKRLTRQGETLRAQAEEGQFGERSVESGKKYSIKVTRNMDYAEQLKQIEDRKLNGSNSLYIGPAPSLVATGFSDAPFAMNQADYRKSRRKEGNNKKYSSHSVPLKFFKNLPQKINDSVIFIDNGTQVTIVTDQLMPDENGSTSYVIAGVWQNQKMDNDIVNQVKSAYPLKDFTYQILQAGKAGRLVVTNKNKATELLASIGVQPAEQSSILGLAKGSITQSPAGSQDGTRNSLRLGAGDEAYMAAVERGDMDEAQRMVDEAAKEWGAYLMKTGDGFLSLPVSPQPFLNDPFGYAYYEHEMSHRACRLNSFFSLLSVRICMNYFLSRSSSKTFCFPILRSITYIFLCCSVFWRFWTSKITSRIFTTRHKNFQDKETSPVFRMALLSRICKS